MDYDIVFSLEKPFSSLHDYAFFMVDSFLSTIEKKSDFPSDARIASLDSIRGLAALIVLFFHIFSSFCGIEEPLGSCGFGSRLFFIANFTPARLLLSGRSAVLLFFILSGYVLNLSQPDLKFYGRFIGKRICRIYLPFLVAILVSSALYLIICPRKVEGLTIWFNTVPWALPVTFSAVIYHLSMTGRLRDMVLDNPMWSLVYELRISLIFPFMAIAVRRSPFFSFCTACALYGMSWLILEREGLSAPDFGRTFDDTLWITCYFIPFFAFGILLSQNREAGSLFIRSCSMPVRISFWGIGLIFMTSSHDLVAGLGAGLVIALTAAKLPETDRILGKRPILWIGRISYSLYLWHMIIIVAILHLFYGHVDTSFLILLIIAICLGVGWISYIWTEKPAIRLGQYCIDRMESRMSLFLKKQRIKIDF